MKSACLIVIGHVDHGKTALVQALTGTDTDRLAQEKERGLSITLGFAHCAMPAGQLDLIDAPGHQDFTRAMVSGATGAQGALLVVSAPDGIEAQTLEHLTITSLLGVPVVAVALTKTDLIPRPDLRARCTEISAALSDRGLGQVPIFSCAARQPGGVETLKQGLAQVMPHLPPVTGPQDAFLPIDRVFTVSGAGTIVSGTLLGDALSIEGAVTVLPMGLKTRIKGLQSRGASRTQVAAGERTAVNLRGVAADGLAAGDVLCTGGSFAASECLDVHLTVSPSAARPVSHMQELRVLFGTTAQPATLRLFGARAIEPGQGGFAQLRFRRGVTGFAGQRLLLRGLSPAETLGGGVILDPLARPTKAGDTARRAVLKAALCRDLDAIADALCQANKGAGWMDDFTRLTRQRVGHLPLGYEGIGDGHFAARDHIEAVRHMILHRLQDYHAVYLIRAMAPVTVLQDRTINPQLLRHTETALLANDVLRRAGDRIALTDHDPWARLDGTDTAWIAAIGEQIAQAGMQPPDLAIFLGAQADADLLDLLVLRGTIVLLQNVALRQTIPFHAATLDRAADDLRQAFAPPAAFTTGQARAALGTSRKYIVPVLEHFDSVGITLRLGDQRIIAPPASQS